MYIYIMRHGETYYNKDGKIQGSTDIELTDFGIELAEMSRDGLAADGIVFDRIYTSPLSRARKTAEIIAEKTLNPDAKAPAMVIDDRIREMCFGKYEGLVLKELKNYDQNIVNCFSDPDAFVADPTGENYEDVFARIDDFIEHVLIPLQMEPEVENVLVLCHGTVIRAFLSRFNQIPMDRFWKIKQPNCSINKIELKENRFLSIQENILYYESEELMNRGIL